MPYITVKQPPVYYQMTFEDIMAGIDDLSKYMNPNVANTRTYRVDYPSAKLLEKTDVTKMIQLLAAFTQSKEALFNRDRASLYHTFHTPKSSGGLRRIRCPTAGVDGCPAGIKDADGNAYVRAVSYHCFCLYTWAQYDRRTQTPSAK